MGQQISKTPSRIKPESLSVTKDKKGLNDIQLSDSPLTIFSRQEAG